MKKSAKRKSTEDAPSDSLHEKKKVIEPYKIKRKMHRMDMNNWKVHDRQEVYPILRKVLDGCSFLGNNGIDNKTAQEIKSHMQDSPHNIDEIKYFVKKNCQDVRMHRKKYDRPIDKWAELIDAVSPDNVDLEQQMISSIMAALEEEIPDPQATKTPGPPDKPFPEPNYSDIYRYLASAIANKPLPDLSPASALVVEECLQSLTEQIKTLDDGDLRKNLRLIFLYLIKDSPETANDEEEDVLNQLSSHSSLINPLAVNHTSIVPVPPN